MNNTRRRIFAQCRQLGLDDDARRDLQLVVTNKASLTDMTDDELKAFSAELERRGAKLTPRKKRPSAPRADLRYVHVLWRLLGEANALKVPGRAGLNAFVRSSFGESWGSVPVDIDALRDAEKITAVIRALENMCSRNGVKLDRSRQRR